MAAPTAAEILRVRRLAIGTSTDTTTLSDADISALWEYEGAGDVTLTAAEACAMLAARFAIRINRFNADGQSVDRTDQIPALRRRAVELRAASSVAGYGSGTLTLTRHEDIGDTDDTEYSE